MPPPMLTPRQVGANHSTSSASLLSRLTTAEALKTQAAVLGEIRMQRRWMQHTFETELQRVEQSLDGVHREARAQQVRDKFNTARDDLVLRERLQQDALSSMQAWEAAGRPSREAGEMPVFACYMQPR